METNKRWRIADIGTFLKNSFMAILKSEFLLRMNVGRYFIHIVYTFVLMGVIIWVSLMIDNTLVKAEKNNQKLQELEILYSEKLYDQAALGRRSTVATMLEQMGSKVTEPTKPATNVNGR